MSKHLTIVIFFILLEKSLQNNLFFVESTKNNDGKEVKEMSDSFINQTVFSHTECSLLCIQNIIQCNSFRLVQLSQSLYQCLLFHAIGLNSFKYIPYTDCKGWLKNGFTKSGVYKIYVNNNWLDVE